MRAPAPARRWIDLGALLALCAGLLLALRSLPLEVALDRLRAWVDGRGLLGLFGFGAAYVLLTLALVPGSALTLTAGALFGVVRGSAVVSVAATTTAALAFLVARHLARARVEAWARRHPRFAAVDRAIGERGWRIVALLRLSPALPFSASNYLYGLSSVRFLPYLIASALCMLPATVLYVMIGAAGAQGLKAAAVGAEGLEGGRIALLAAGVVATLAATIWIARSARRALATSGELDLDAAGTGARASAPSRRWMLHLAALFALAAGLAAHAAREELASLVGGARSGEQRDSDADRSQESQR